MAIGSSAKSVILIYFDASLALVAPLTKQQWRDMQTYQIDRCGHFAHSGSEDGRHRQVRRIFPDWTLHLVYSWANYCEVGF